MATNQRSGIVPQPGKSGHFSDGTAIPDEQLLELFIRQRDESAFEGLVIRHGAMVMGVCRRILRNTQDAEDAFQATFVVLVRKASAIRRRELVGNWLFGTAYRAAMEVKAARRRSKEVQVTSMPQAPTADEVELWRGLRPVLDQELNRLPEKYRVPVILCDLEGGTRREVARQLGIPEGTLSGRLTTARRLLARRLGRHGFTLSVGALVVMLTQQSAAASVQGTLVASTVHAATALAAGQAANVVTSAKVATIADGVLKALLMSKLKVAAVAIVIGGWLFTGGNLLTPSHSDTPAGNVAISAKQLPRGPELQAIATNAGPPTKVDQPKNPIADRGTGRDMVMMPQTDAVASGNRQAEGNGGSIALTSGYQNGQSGDQADGQNGQSGEQGQQNTGTNQSGQSNQDGGY